MFDGHSWTNQDHDVIKFYLPWLNTCNDISCLHLRSLISLAIIYTITNSNGSSDHVSWSDIVCVSLTMFDLQTGSNFVSKFVFCFYKTGQDPSIINCSYFILSVFYK